MCIGLNLVKCLAYMFLYESGYCCGRKFGNLFQGLVYYFLCVLPSYVFSNNQRKMQVLFIIYQKCPQQLRMGAVSSPIFQEKYTRAISTDTEPDFPSHT